MTALCVFCVSTRAELLGISVQPANIQCCSSLEVLAKLCAAVSKELAAGSEELRGLSAAYFKHAVVAVVSFRVSLASVLTRRAACGRCCVPAVSGAAV